MEAVPIRPDSKPFSRLPDKLVRNWSDVAPTSGWTRPHLGGAGLFLASAFGGVEEKNMGAEAPVDKRGERKTYDHFKCCSADAAFAQRNTCLPA